MIGAASCTYPRYVVHVVYPRSTPIAHGSAGSSFLVINYCSPIPS